MKQLGLSYKLLVPSLVLIVAMIVSAVLVVGDSELWFLIYPFIIVRILFIMVLNLRIFKFRKLFLIIGASTIISWFFELVYLFLFLSDSHHTIAYNEYILISIAGFVVLIISQILAFYVILSEKKNRKPLFNFSVFLTIFSLFLVESSSVYYRIEINPSGMSLINYIQYDAFIFIMNYAYIIIFLAAMYRERKVQALNQANRTTEELEVIQ